MRGHSLFVFPLFIIFLMQNFELVFGMFEARGEFVIKSESKGVQANQAVWISNPMTIFYLHYFFTLSMLVSN